MKKLVLLLSLLLIAFAALEASADTITLTQVPKGAYQQTSNTPCIFGYSAGTCGNSNPFGYNNTTSGSIDTGTKAGGKDPSYTLTTQYTLAQMSQLLGGDTQFKLGYDVNQGGDVQHLAGFLIQAVGPNGTTLYSLPSPGSDLPLVSNGTGYADYLMSAGGNWFSIAGLPTGTTAIRFTYTMNVANDGGEQVWLIAKNAPNPVPEPATLLLFGTSMLGAVPMLRRRKK